MDTRSRIQGAAELLRSPVRRLVGMKHKRPGVAPGTLEFSEMTGGIAGGRHPQKAGEPAFTTCSSIVTLFEKKTKVSIDGWMDIPSR